MQEFLTAWIQWYYGNGEYPLALQDKMTYDEKMLAITKTSQIKKIMGTK